MWYGFAARAKDELRATPFDLVLFVEPLKSRNAYQPSRRGGQAVRRTFDLRASLLLTVFGFAASGPLPGRFFRASAPRRRHGRTMAHASRQRPAPGP